MPEKASNQEAEQKPVLMDAYVMFVVASCMLMWSETANT